MRKIIEADQEVEPKAFERFSNKFVGLNLKDDLILDINIDLNFEKHSLALKESLGKIQTKLVVADEK